MKMGYKELGAALGVLAVAALGLAPSALQAQAADTEGFIRYSPVLFSTDVRGGVAVAGGDLGDVADAGVTLGAGVAYFLNPRFALRLDGNVDFLQGRDEQPGAPTIRAWHYTGGFEVHLTEPSDPGLSFVFDLGAGGMYFHSDEFNGQRFRDTNFQVKGGARVGVNVSPVVNLFVGGAARMIMANEEGNQDLSAFYGVEPFETVWTFPLEGGLRINVP